MQRNSFAILVAHTAFVAFLSAFLLFQIQPMISKYFLPVFGGSSSVWIVASFLFQTLLIAGYLYAYWIVKLQLISQIRIHFLVVSLIIIIQMVISKNWLSVIMPDRLAIDLGIIRPEFHLISLVFTSVGMIYLILAATTVIIHNWFFVYSNGKSPYWLFRASNAGSLLGLISYPFLVEPNTDLISQGWIWFGLFLLYVALLFGIILFRPQAPNFKQDTNYHKGHGNLKHKFLTWVLLASIPSSTMLALTNNLTLGVAPIPFLWVIPLSIYLISFILAFGNTIKVNFTLSLLCFLSLLMAVHLRFVENVGFVVFYPQLVIYMLAFLFGATFIHKTLYNSRPHPKLLSYFYLAISIGGALGGLFVGVIAPFIFYGYWEVEITLILSLATVLILTIRNPKLIPERAKKWVFDYNFGHIILLTIFIVFVGTNLLHFRSSIYSNRNFYGTTKVTKSDNLYYVFSGRIIHGSQDKNNEKSPTSYYSPESGIGLAFARFEKLNPDKKKRLGVLGLGAGTVASFCKSDEDEIVFFEINPDMVFIAKNYFSYLDICNKKEIVLGDGRLSLEREIDKQEKYNILVIDAFTDDAIPVHLITKEAFEIYTKRLQEDGILIVNISNRFIDLTKPIKKITEDLGLEMKVTIYQPDPDSVFAETHWVLVARDNSLIDIDSGENIEVIDTVETKHLKTWTDDYNSILQVLR